MVNDLAEKITEQDEKDLISLKCPQTGQAILVPRRIYEMAERKDKAVLREEVNGFYISPCCFSFYASKEAYNMFLAD
jgi:hypothetical protein